VRTTPETRTLGIDVGGSGIKGAVVDADGTMTSDRHRIDTPYPCPPDRLVTELIGLRAGLPGHDRVTVGFPGLVRHGRVELIVALSRRSYGGKTDPKLVRLWAGYPLADTLATAFAVPTKVANDADVQGCAAAEGTGFEFVMTLGTGVGAALFSEGRLLPHLELGHAPFRLGDTFEDRLGNKARKKIGNRHWQTRVLRAIDAYRQFLFFDRIHIGGGNAKHLDPDKLPDDARILPNTAGITGGVRIWDLDH
jgi:polyphosphate glucokinase